MRVNVDKLGAYASAICAVHCVLTGLALGVLSVVGLGFFASETTEMAFVGTAMLLGSWAVVSGHRKHHSYTPALFFALGVAGLFLSHFVFKHPHDGHTPISLGATWSSVMGGTSLVMFHVVNLHKAHRHNHSSCAVEA